MTIRFVVTNTNIKVNAGVPDKFLYILQKLSSVCEYATISKTAGIILQPIDQGNNVQGSRKVSLHSLENGHFKL